MSENTVIKDTIKKPKMKKPHKPNSYKVTDELLLYRIADSGLLFTYLHGVNIDKNGNKVFYFERHPDIKGVIDKFMHSIEEQLHTSLLLWNFGRDGFMLFRLRNYLY